MVASSGFRTGQKMRTSLLLSGSVGVLLVATGPANAGPWDWTGFYAGVLGGTGGTQTDVVETLFTPTEFAYVSGPGLVSLLSGGYNTSYGNLVVGIDARAGFAAIHAEGDSISGTTSIDLSGLAMLEGRIGLPIDKLLVYGGGGLAVGRFAIANTADSSESFAGFVPGVVVSAGAEYRVTDKMSVRADLSLLHFQTINSGGSGYSLASTPNAAIGTVGAQFHF